MDDSKIRKLYDDLLKNKYFEIEEELLKKLQKIFKFHFCDENEIKNKIKKVKIRSNYLLDTHTAGNEFFFSKYFFSCQMCSG